MSASERSVSKPWLPPEYSRSILGFIRSELDPSHLGPHLGNCKQSTAQVRGWQRRHTTTRDLWEEGGIVSITFHGKHLSDKFRITKVTRISPTGEIHIWGFIPDQ